MRCSKCSAENLEGRRYCGECGAVLFISCHKCGFINSLTDRYCGGCGMSLACADALPGEEPASVSERPGTSSKYSFSDISELIGGGSPGHKETKKKPEVGEAMSQEALDDLFASDKSKRDEDN